MNWFMHFGADASSFVISSILVLVYHVHLYRMEKRHPTYTVQAVNRLARTRWVESIMSGPGKDVLAVQTLRNSTMAATFLASTAVLLIIGALTLSGQGDKLEGTWHALNVVGASHPELWLFKLLLLLLNLFVAFFSFSLSIRVFNHVGYMINVPLDPTHRAISPLTVAAHLNRAGKFYSLGMRAYYFTVPLVFWLFGPHFMLLATIGLIIVLRRIDRAPEVGD